MKIENLSINHSLTNGLIENIKENKDIIGFIIAGLDHGFKASLPGSLIMTYGKIIIGCHTSGNDRKSWITHTKSDKVILLMAFDCFHWDKINIYKGCLYYNKQFICKTN
jgi:hypothetical protein